MCAGLVLWLAGESTLIQTNWLLIQSHTPHHFSVNRITSTTNTHLDTPLRNMYGPPSPNPFQHMLSGKIMRLAGLKNNSTRLLRFLALRQECDDPLFEYSRSFSTKIAWALAVGNSLAAIQEE